MLSLWEEEERDRRTWQWEDIAGYLAATPKAALVQVLGKESQEPLWQEV